MRLLRVSLFALAACVAPVFAAAPTWDSSGNGQLNGTYYFRQVLYVSDSSANISRAMSYFGNITFNGAGSYTITSGTWVDSTNGISSLNPTGTYSVASSGYGFMSSPLIASASVYFLVSKGNLLGADTESGYNDLFLATPATGSFGNSSFQGAYTMSAFFPGGSPASAADGTYQLNPDGAGHLGTVSITGYTGSGGATAISQSSANVTYTTTSGAFVVTFPTSTTANFYSGKIYLYASPDTNLVFGGSPTGYDMVVGVRTTGATGTPISGLYYEAGLDENTAPTLDTFYGAFNASNGTVIGHERLLLPGVNPQGNSYTTTYPTTTGSSYKDPFGSTQYTVGAGGIRIAFGIGPYMAIGVALPYTPPAATGSVYLEPTGIVNTASSAPFTAGIAPGEFLTFYNGKNLASSTVIASSVPFPTKLGNNVQVLIDGIAAPIYYVSPTQISVLVPYAVSTFPVATIQVINSTGSSNIVTAYVNTTAPGVFTFNTGIGYAAAQHGNYQTITPSNPALPGETIVAYLTGLGAVFPPVADGAASPNTGSTTIANVAVYVNQVLVPATATPYVGLTPSAAGLYQVNFQVPTTATAGDNSIGIAGPDSYSEEALISVGTAAASAVAPAPLSATQSEQPATVLRQRLPRLSVPAPASR